MLGQRQYPEENQTVLEKTLEKIRNTKHAGTMESKKGVSILFSFWRDHTWFAPTWKATENNVTNISFSHHFWKEETASQTALPQQCQCCSSLDHVMSWIMQPISIWNDKQLKKGVFLSQISSPSPKTKRKVSHHRRGGAEVGTAVPGAARRETHRKTTLNSICSKQNKMKKGKLAFQEMHFYFFN